MRAHVESDGQAYRADDRTIIQRLRDKLFPWGFSENRPDFIERGKGRGFTTVTHIFLDWPDRLRVLAGGIIVVEVVSNTEEDPGQVEAMGFTNIAAPWSLPRGKE